MRTEFDIVGSFNNQRNRSVDSERTINLYEFSDPETKRGKSLLPTAGLLSRINFALNRAGRGAFVFGPNLYVVVGENVYLINQNLIINKIGTLTTFTGQVDIDANVNQVIFVDGVAGYLWDTIASTFTALTAFQKTFTVAGSNLIIDSTALLNVGNIIQVSSTLTLPAPLMANVN